jgi:hypothetical protein
VNEVTAKPLVPIPLLAAANLFAALGSGKLLSDVMSFAADGDEQQLSAFLVGTIIGLAILTQLPAASKNAMRAWLSLGAAGCSALLLWIYSISKHGIKLQGAMQHLFFAVLCIRFSLWFVPRVLRSNLAAGYHQKISYVEMMYYIGVCAGLVMWGRFGLAGGIAGALIFDIVFQLTAATLDGFSLRYFEPIRSQTLGLQIEASPARGNFALFWSLTLVLGSTTVGTQIVIFLLSHSFQDRQTNFPGNVTIATFYAGAAVAAVLCAYWKPSLALRSTAGAAQAAGARISLSRHQHREFVPFTAVAAICALLVALALAAGFVNHPSAAIVLFLIIIATILYETMFLVMLDRLGEERDRNARPWLVSTAFGIVGSVAAASYMGLHHFFGVLSIWPLLGTVAFCLSLTAWVTFAWLKDTTPATG